MGMRSRCPVEELTTRIAEEISNSQEAGNLPDSSYCISMIMKWALSEARLNFISARPDIFNESRSPSEGY
jgi:hypothetical protein